MMTEYTVIRLNEKGIPIAYSFTTQMTDDRIHNNHLGSENNGTLRRVEVTAAAVRVHKSQGNSKSIYVYLEQHKQTDI